MAKAKRNIGQEILDGLRELKGGEYGRVINVPDVAGIREKTGLSQARFAALLGVSVRTLQDWEQGRRAPSGAARTLLMVADRNPRALLDVAWAILDKDDGTGMRSPDELRVENALCSANIGSGRTPLRDVRRAASEIALSRIVGSHADLAGLVVPSATPPTRRRIGEPAVRITNLGWRPRWRDRVIAAHV